MNALTIIGLCLMFPLVITLIVCGISDIVKATKDPLVRIVVIIIMFILYGVGLILFNLSFQ